MAFYKADGASLPDTSPNWDRAGQTSSPLLHNNSHYSNNIMAPTHRPLIVWHTNNSIQNIQVAKCAPLIKMEIQLNLSCYTSYTKQCLVTVFLVKA